MALALLSPLASAYAQEPPGAEPAPPSPAPQPPAPSAPAPPQPVTGDAPPASPEPIPALAPAPEASAPAPTEPGAAPAPESLAAPAPEAGTAASGDVLKAVVVTAQRREESAQSVPTPVAVLGGENLLDSGIGRSAKEILDYVPNASAITQFHGRPRWWIRGVGTGQQQLDFSNPIGFYLDEVYIGNATATGFPLFDLDRVEVLRGPQGTLWGKNTTGGAISIVSRKPEFESDGYLKADYGSFNNLVLEGAHGGAVWEDLAARASFHYESHGGRFENLYTGRSEGQLEEAAARLQLLGRLPGVRALANVHARKYSVNGNLTTVNSNAASREYVAGYVPSTDVNDISSNAPSSDSILQLGSLLNLEAEIDRYTLTSISAYEDFRSTTFGDGDNTPLEINRTWANAESYQLSEEIRLASPREDAFNWIVGAYALYESIDRESSAARLPDVAIGAPPPPPPNYNFTEFVHDTASLAAFASATWDVSDAFGLTGGLRWTVERRELDIVRLAAETPASFSNIGLWWEPLAVASPLAPVYDGQLQKTWNNWTYDITPEYRFTKDVLGYLRYAHGVKSGGFNTAATTPEALNVVDPETLDDFEVGLKSSLFDRRLVLNLSAFYYIYEDIQVNVVGPLPPTNVAVSYLQNVEEGRAYGAELEFDALPVRDLHLGGSVGLLETEFTDFTVLNTTNDYSGNSFVRSPLLTVVLRGSYRVPLGAGPSLLLGADYRGLTRQVHFTTNQDNPLLGTSPFSVVNARVSLQSDDEKLLLTAYVNNLLNVKYRAHTLPGAQGATGSSVQWSEPTTVGASLTVRWY